MSANIVRTMGVVGLLLLAACTVQDSKDHKELGPNAPVAKHAPASQPDESLPPLTLQQEADAKAAQAISKENADAELEKLKKELGGGE